MSEVKLLPAGTTRRYDRMSSTTTTVHVFRGVQYATAARFQAPVPRHIVDRNARRDRVRPGRAAADRRSARRTRARWLRRRDRRARVPDAERLDARRRTPSASQPVLVWFPGGAFTIGASSQPVYDGARFCAEQDVVIVTCNYRLGALGFLDARAGRRRRQLRAARRDRRARVGARQHRRVRRRPGRVTVFGESAGGGIVLHLAASPPRARSLRGRDRAERRDVQHARRARAAALVLDALLAELGARRRRSSCSTCRSTSWCGRRPRPRWRCCPTVGMMPFHPMVDGDVLPAPPVGRAGRRMRAAGVPLVVGTTTDEMRLFLDLSGEPPARDRLCTRVARYLGVDDASARARSSRPTRRRSRRPTPTRSGPRSSPTSQMQVPADAMRDAHAAHGPTYSYLFTWPAVNPQLGACHGIDIPFTFGNFVDGWAEFVGADDAARRCRPRAARRVGRRSPARGDPAGRAAPATMMLRPRHRRGRRPVARAARVDSRSSGTNSSRTSRRSARRAARARARRRATRRPSAPRATAS